MPDNFLVIRIHPNSPVDGATFSTYLEDLQIKVYAAGTYPGTAAQPAVPLGQTQVNAATLNLVAVPWMTGTYVASVSKRVATNTAGSSGNFGATLDVPDAAGIAFGSVPTCQADSKMFAGNTTVTKIPAATNPTALTLSQNIVDFAAQDTVVTFYFAYGPGSPNSNAPSSINATFTGTDPSFTFDVKVAGAVTNSPTVRFAHSDGIAVGMTMTSGSGVPANTTVLAVPDGASVTLSNNVNLANNATVTFQSDLSSEIMQHVEPLGVGTIFGTVYVPIPASVATAIIPLTLSIPEPPANSFLDVTVVATRGGVSIPINNDFFDVIVTQGSAPTPDQYQSQPLQNTSLYLTLPAPPDTNTIDLTIPTDGTAPNFDDLFTAMTKALANDTNFPAGTTLDNLSPADCTRMSYDIVWSQQGNTLPPPPDTLEFPLHESAQPRRQRRRRQHQQPRAGPAEIRGHGQQLLRDPQRHRRTPDQIRGGRIDGAGLRGDQPEVAVCSDRISSRSSLQPCGVGRKRAGPGGSRRQRRQRARLRRSGGVFLCGRRQPRQIDDRHATLPARNRRRDRPPVSGVQSRRASQLDRRS